jgi:hypothetical protein
MSPPAKSDCRACKKGVIYMKTSFFALLAFETMLGFVGDLVMGFVGPFREDKLGPLKRLLLEL